MAMTMLRTDVFFRSAELALATAVLMATMACSRGNVHAAPAMPLPLGHRSSGNNAGWAPVLG
jgi:uncharacterized membrane protein